MHFLFHFSVCVHVHTLVCVRGTERGDAETSRRKDLSDPLGLPDLACEASAPSISLRLGL